MVWKILKSSLVDDDSDINDSDKNDYQSGSRKPLIKVQKRKRRNSINETSQRNESSKERSLPPVYQASALRERSFSRPLVIAPELTSTSNQNRT